VTGATRIAIEVYPHTALVSLFGLAAVLKYKAGRARSVDARRREFGRLLDCLLVLRDASPGLDVTASRSWARVATMVARAKTNAALDRVEDELDAYVCAYVGAHYGARRGTRDCVVIGDARQGYVVTPVDATRWDTVRAAAGRYAVPIA
jgi:predicted RNase H-like nuclease